MAINWPSLVGQQRVKDVLGAAYEHGTLGHAYLFCGDEGVGTFAAAVDLAMVVLCQGEPGSIGLIRPCGACDSCHRLHRFSHPDFHLLFPVALQKDQKASDGNLKQKGWESLAETARQRIADPYVALEEEGAPLFPVEWIREVTDAIHRGSVGGGMNVTVMTQVHLMGKESANALLKTLEEPPSSTLMILCTERPQDLLPTIASRCQILRFGALPPEVLNQALVARFSESTSLARIQEALSLSQGSLRRAIQTVVQPHPRARELAISIFSLAMNADLLSVCKGIEAIVAEGDSELYQKALTHCLYLVRNAALAGVGVARTYFAELPALSGLSTLDLPRAHRLVAILEMAIRAIKARAHPALTISGLVFEISEIIHGK